MKVRFQADADLNEILIKAALRREPGIDFQTSHTAGLVGSSDKDVLTLASRSGRLLVTHDRKTMPRHFAEFIAKQSSAGVLIIPQNMPDYTGSRRFDSDMDCNRSGGMDQ